MRIDRDNSILSVRVFGVYDYEYLLACSFPALPLTFITVVVPYG